VEEGDVSPARDGGVIKTVIARGEGWARPEAGDEIFMMYTGTLEDGTVFDSSYDRDAGPFTFKLGSNTVIRGMDITAKSMAKNEKCRVVLAPSYAYGSAGSPPKIPPSATLTFDLHLIDFQSKNDLYSDGSVVMKELEPGAGWERPGPLAYVTVLCTASAISATLSASPPVIVYDGTISATLGAGRLPETWDKVIPDMKSGSKVELVCKVPRLFGSGIPDNVILPPGVTAVKCTLTLVSWLKVEIVSPDDSSIIKQIVSSGDGWERPSEGASVVVDLAYSRAPAAARVTTTKDNPDASFIAAATDADLSQPFATEKGKAFVLGDGSVVDGLDRAIQSMKLGEVARITLTPSMAYGSAPDLLMPHSDVSADDPICIAVTLVSFQKAKDMWSMSFVEKADEMMKRKLLGNKLFVEGRIPFAIKAYERAVALFDSPTTELTLGVKKRVNELLVQSHVNLAACFDRRHDSSQVITHCSKALDIEPSNVKALYRRGSAYIAIDDYYNASADLKYALQLSPGNADIKRRLLRLSALQTRQDRKDKKLYSNLFTRLSKMEENEKDVAAKTNPDTEVQTGCIEGSGADATDSAGKASGADAEKGCCEVVKDE
jgi:FK506-binding protein 4/5